MASGSDDGTFRLWAAYSGEKQSILETRTGYGVAAAWSPDGKTLGTAPSDSTIRLWDVEKGKNFRTPSSLHFVSFDWSPDGKTLVTGSDNGSINFWDAKSGMQVRRYEWHTDWGWICPVDWFPDGKILASAITGGAILLWDVDSGERLRTLERPASQVESLALSPDGKTLVAGYSDETFIFWSVDSGEQLGTGQGVYVAWSPDGKTLASVGWDGAIF